MPQIVFACQLRVVQQDQVQLVSGLHRTNIRLVYTHFRESKGSSTLDQHSPIFGHCALANRMKLVLVDNLPNFTVSRTRW